MASLANFSLLSLFVIAQACLVLSANINNATDFIQSSKLPSKRGNCAQDQKVDLADRSYCNYAVPPRVPILPKSRHYRIGKRASDIPLMQNFTTTKYKSRWVAFRDLRRTCQDYKIIRSGDYIVYLRCDPDPKDGLDGMSVIVRRGEKSRIQTRLGCTTSGGKITSSQIALNLCKDDVVVTTFVTITGGATEVQIVPFRETDECGFDPNLINRIYKRNSSPRRDVLDKHYGLDYQSRSLLTPGNRVKRHFKRKYCQRFQLSSNAGVYWIMFTANGLKKGAGKKYMVTLKRGRKPIVLFVVEPQKTYQSRALAAYAPKNSFIFVYSDSKRGCDSNSTDPRRNKYQVSTAYLGYNQFRDGYIYGSYKVSDHYSIRSYENLRFQEYVDRFIVLSINQKRLSDPNPIFKDPGHSTFQAPEAGRYIVSLLVKSVRSLTFKLTYLNYCKNLFVPMDAAFYFENLPSTQSHVIYMKKGGRIKVKRTHFNTRLYYSQPTSHIGVGTTFSIAYVHPL